MQFEVEIAGGSNFFAHVSADIFDSLLGEYNATRTKILDVPNLTGGREYSAAPVTSFAPLASSWS